MLRDQHVGAVGSRGVALAALSAALLVGLPSVAEARTEILRWTYSDPGRITGFRVHLGATSGSYGSVFDVGLPALVSGVYSVAVEVADADRAFSAISAYNATQQSALSNERELPPPSGGGSAGPPPVASWSDDFAGYAAGDDPTGWVDTRANNSMARDDALFEVVNLGGNQVFATASQETDIHSHFVSAASSQWSAYEFHGRMRIAHPDAGIGVTALSRYPSQDAYYRLRRQGGSPGTAPFHQWPHPSPGRTVTCTASTTFGPVPVANAWYRFRFQVRAEASRTSVRTKTWAESQPEPTAWQQDCFDGAADHLVAGTIGLWSTGPGSKYWDDLALFELDAQGNPIIPTGRPAAPVLLP